MSRPRCRQAIGLGLLLPGLLLAHPGAADAVTRTAAPAPKKAPPKSHPVSERRARIEPAPAAVGRTVHVVRARSRARSSCGSASEFSCRARGWPPGRSR